MKQKILFLFLIAIFLFIFSGFGCLGDPSPKSVDISKGQISSYEIDLFIKNITNSSTFFLETDKKNKTIQVVTTIENTADLQITVPKYISMDDRSKKDQLIEDLFVIGKTVSNNESNYSNILYNTTYVKSSSMNIINIQFAEPISGFVAYSYPGVNSQFHHYLSRNETITIVLPPGHDTTNIILGFVKPEKPDEKITDNNNRIRLIWNDPYPKINHVSVKYYRESLPFILSILGILIGIGFLITSLYYTNEIRKIKRKQELIESDTSVKSML